eukprot:UC4_evm1s1188
MASNRSSSSSSSTTAAGSSTLDAVLRSSLQHNLVNQGRKSSAALSNMPTSTSLKPKSARSTITTISTASSDHGIAPQDAHVLICESHEVLQRLLHAWLTNLGVQHTQVFDGEQAVAACCKIKFSVIFVDVDARFSPPVQSGFDVAFNARSQGLNINTPIIGWSGQENVEEQCLDAGMNSTLKKPFNKSDIEGLIHQWAGVQVENMTQVVSPGVSQTGDPSSSLLDLTGFVMPTEFQEVARPKTARVLVVDDCHLTQHIITSLLRELSSDISQAFDGEEAIAKCNSSVYDIIFMDLHMPKVNGLVATQRIRAGSRHNLFTPIIAFTSTGTLEQYKSVGINDLLPKPFTIESLSDIFDKWTPWGKGMMDFTDPSGPTLGFTDSDSFQINPMPIDTSVPIVQDHGMSSSKKPKNNKRKAPADKKSTKDSPSSQPGNNSKTPNKTASGLKDNGKSAPPNKKSKKVNTLGHTEKEKLRRASIVNSCNCFRDLVPTVREADKATVFRIAVEYMSFLRNMVRSMLSEYFSPSDLAEADLKFEKLLKVNSLDNKKSKLKFETSDLDTGSKQD